MLLRFVLDNISYKFMWLCKVSFLLFIVLVIVFFVGFFIVGFNYGIDFKGGMIIEIKIDGFVDIGVIWFELLLFNFGDV